MLRYATLRTAPRRTAPHRYAMLRYATLRYATLKFIDMPCARMYFLQMFMELEIAKLHLSVKRSRDAADHKNTVVQLSKELETCDAALQARTYEG